MSQVSLASSPSVARALRGPLLFCTGFTSVFVAAGFVLARGSLALRQWQIRIGAYAGWVAVAAGLLLVAMHLGVLDRFPRLFREWRLHPRDGRTAPFVMGVAFGFGWTPCLGPILTAILALTATSGAELVAIANMLAYAAGLAIPFLALGVGVTSATRGLAWFRRHARTVGVVSGLALSVFGFAMASGAIRHLAIWAQQAVGTSLDGVFGVDGGSGTTLILSFVFGFLSFVSPCCLPLVPGYLALTAGQAAATADAGSRRP